jgi:hypothetical protein
MREVNHYVGFDVQWNFAKRSKHRIIVVELAGI